MHRRSHSLPRLAGATLALLLLASCVDHSPLTPTPPEAPAASQSLGVVEITISGLAEGSAPSARVRSAANPSYLRAARDPGAPSLDLAPPSLGSGSADGTIQLRPLSTGSFTEGTRGEDGVRYLWATFQVRNAQQDGTPYDEPLNNLTFVAVSTAGTIGETAVSSLQRFDGSAADASIATEVVPTGAVQKNPVTGALISAGPDVLQVFSEEEAAAVARAAGVQDVFPYGFMARGADGSGRGLGASPAAEEWEGIVTFAFRMPLQASAAEDPFNVTMMFQALTDSETRLTESLEEQQHGGGAAFQARATALGANSVTLLPGSSYAGELPSRTLFDVRIAGSAGNPTQVLAPRPDAPDIEPSTISAGLEHSCGLATDGAAYCWGNNLEGRLGDGTTSSRSTPVEVAGGHRFTSISAGSRHTVALTADGEIYSWGRNNFGQLGDGTTIDRHVPVRVTSEHRFESISAGHFHTVALTDEEEAFAWGDNWAGQLGDSTYIHSHVPVRVAGGLRFRSVSGGDSYSVALTADGDTYAWGRNHSGQLGDGTTTTRNAPVPATGGHRFRSISAGAFHTIALTAEGDVYAWGQNWNGQLGDGSNTNRNAPAPTAGGHRFRSISAGLNITMALTAEGDVYAWGQNGSGQLGDGSTTARNAPVPAAAGYRFRSISAGAFHTMALTAEGDVYAWGQNQYGQLGDGTTNNSSTPIQPEGGAPRYLVP